MNEQLIKEKEQIIRSFGIDIEEVEPTVYKVLNTDKEFNIDKLKWALEQCIVIASLKTHYEKETNGAHTLVSRIYYIVAEFNSKLGLKYDDIVYEESGDSLYQPYKYNPNNSHADSIDTIYSEEEM